MKGITRIQLDFSLGDKANRSENGESGWQDLISIHPL